MSKFALAAAALLAIVPVGSLAIAQEAPADPMATAQASAATQVAAARQTAETPDPAVPCQPKKKKKKGFGLGGILKAASKSGLGGMVGGGLLGQAGAMTNAAINTGVGIAESAAGSKPDTGAC